MTNVGVTEVLDDVLVSNRDGKPDKEGEEASHLV